MSKRIAIIGGTAYDEAALEDFLYKLHSKYPDAEIVTGSGRGAEAQAKTLMEAIGQNVTVASAPLNDIGLQIERIIEGDIVLYKDENGKTQHKQVSRRVDIIVIVGDKDGSRPKKAFDIWKRLDSWREKEYIRPLFRVAEPPPKAKAKKAKPKKKREETNR